VPGLSSSTVTAPVILAPRRCLAVQTMAWTMRNRIKSAVANFIDVPALTDDEVTELIRRREIDVIVEASSTVFFDLYTRAIGHRDKILR
jgi:predicted O-linked N-acetylglucosamine transferase (SPINDLY family)